MPQASAELAAKMQEYFGNSVDDEGPLNQLRQSGYKLSRQWEWRKDGITSYKDMDEKDYHCLCFLVQEWDYGGLATANTD